MKRIFPIGLITLGTLLAVGALGWLYFGSPFQAADANVLPNQLAGLERIDYQTGAQAIAGFENLHSKQFPLISGAIGTYGDRQITVWIAGTYSESSASLMVESMREKIAEGNSPFTPLTQTNNNNRSVYVLDRYGAKTFYFQSKNLVIWVAVEPALADTVIQQTLEVYP